MPDLSDADPHDTSPEVAMATLAGLGFTGHFEIEDDGSCRCISRGTSSSPERCYFEDRRRVSRASEPAELTNVLALTCPQ